MERMSWKVEPKAMGLAAKIVCRLQQSRSGRREGEKASEIIEDVNRQDIVRTGSDRERERERERERVGERENGEG